MSTFTANIGLEQPANGADSGTWDVPLNSDLGVIDQALGTSVSKSFTNVDITLSVAQAAFFQFNCSGTLSGNVNLIFPSAIGGRRIINNQCTGNFTLKVKNGAGDTGVVVGQALQTPILLTTGTAFYDNTGAVKLGGASLASASTTDLGSVPQGTLSITGTTTINSFGSSAAIGETKFLRFAGILTLTYNAASLILPSAANITTAAGDTALATQASAGNWIVSFYQRASGTALIIGSGVTSFNGRINAVVPTTGDYTTAELTTATTSGAPSAGQIGETIAATGTSVAIGTGPQTDVTSVSLTAGHWRLSATAAVVNTSQVTTNYGGSISLVTGTRGAGFFQLGGFSIPANNTLGFTPPDLIVRVSGATTVYLGMWNGATGGGTGTGTLTAQRTD